MFEPWLWAVLAWPLPVCAPALLDRISATPIARRAAGCRPVMELRVDVHLQPTVVEDDLKALHARLEHSGLLEHGTAIIKTHAPHLIFRHREADGEHYVYVEDTARGVLAGYTVFNRLVEVNRQLDRFVRAPHSKYATAYQRRGIATAVYEWALAQGFCLISGARLSPGANALWQSLANRHRLEHVDIRNKRIHCLGAQIDRQTEEASRPACCCSVRDGTSTPGPQRRRDRARSPGP